MAENKSLGNLYYSLGLDDTEFNKKMAEAKKRVEEGNFRISPNIDTKELTSSLGNVKRASSGAAKQMKDALEETIPSFQKVDDRLKQLNNYYRELERTSQRAANARKKEAERQSNGEFREYIQSLTGTTGIQKSLSNYYRELERTSKAQGRLNASLRSGVSANRELRRGFELTNKTMISMRTFGIQLSNQLGTMFSIYAAQGWVRQLAEARGEFEMQEIALKAILQDAEAAGMIFSKVKSLAVVSPFEFKDLIAYTKQLSAFSVPVEELYGTMKSLADVSAGLGVDMSRLVLAYGQVRSAAVLRGQELRQFTEAGIPLVDELAKKFSLLENRVVSAGEVFDKISKREVPFAMVKEIMEDLTSVSGKFYMMQEKQSESLRGRISNLSDAYAIMLNDIGQSNEGLLKGGVDAIYFLIENWKEVAKIIQTVIGTLGTYKAVMITLTAVHKAWVAINMTQQMLNAIRAIRGLTAVTKAQIVAQEMLNFVTVKNPYVLIASVLATVVASLIYFRKETQTTAQAIQEVTDHMAEIENKTSQMESDMKGYLNILQDNTVEENKRIQAYQKLLELYPQIFKNMDIEAAKIANRTELMEEANKQDALSIAVEAHKQLIAAEQKYIDLVNRRKAAEAAANQPLMMGGGMAGRTNAALAFSGPSDEDIANAKAQMDKYQEMYKDYMDQVIGLYKDKRDKASQTWRKDAEQLSKDLFAGLAPKPTDTFQSYAKGLVDMLDDFKKQKDVFGKKRPEYDEAAKQWDALTVKIDQTRKALAFFGIQEKLTKSELAKDPIAESWKKRLDLMKDAVSTYFQLRKEIGSEAAEKKVAGDDRFVGLDFSIENFKKMVDKAIASLGDTKMQQNVKAQWLKLISTFSTKDFKAKLEEAVQAVNRSLDTSEQKWKEFDEMMAATGDREYSMNFVFGGENDFDSFAEELSKKLDDTMKEMGIYVPIIFDESEAKEMFGENGELFQLWKRTKDAMAKETADMTSMIAQAVKNSLTGDDIRASLEAQRNKAISSLMRSGYEANSREVEAVVKMWNEKIADAMFEDFKKTDLWATTFEDMERTSTYTLNTIISELERFKATVGKDLPIQDFKTLVQTIDKLKKEVEGRNPFKLMAQSIREMNKASKEMDAVKKAIKDIENTNFEGLEGYTIKKVLDSNLDENIKKMARAQKVTVEYTDANGNAVKEVMNLTKALKKLGKAEDAEKSASDKFKDSLEGISGYANMASEVLGDLGDVISELGNEDMGEAISMAGEFVDSISNIGTAFAQGGVVGAVAAGAVEAIGWIGKVFDVSQKKIRKQRKALELEALKIQNLYDYIQDTIDYSLQPSGLASTSNKEQMDLDISQWEKLRDEEKTLIDQITENRKNLENAQMDFGIRDSFTKESEYMKGLYRQQKDLENKLKANKEQQAVLADRQAAYEKGGLYGYQEQLQKEQLANLKEQRAKMEKDKHASKEEKAALDREIQKTEQQLKTFTEDLAASLYGIDFKGWASQLADSLIGAFAAGEDAAEAFDKTVGDIMRNVVKSMAVEGIILPIFEKMRLYLFGDKEKGVEGVMSDKNLSADDVKGLKPFFDEIKDSIPEVENLINVINDSFGGILNTGDKANDLAKNIQAVTEDTAQLLGSYLNAIRQDVAISRNILTQIHGTVGAIGVSVAVTNVHLMGILHSTNRIASSIDSLSTASSRGGKGLKVIIS